MNSFSDLDLMEKLACHEARDSFFAFRQFINPNLKIGWWQREISRALQQFYIDLCDGKRPKLVIQAPPQHGKSLLVIDFLAWLSGKNPDCKMIYTSFSERLGVRANLRLQRMFDGKKYQLIFPGTVINGTGKSQSVRNREIIEFGAREGYFRNTTVCGSITGESLDLGVIDDPIKGREQANSITIRDKTYDWLTDDFFTRFSEEAGLLCILTRWHVDDPIGRMLEHDDTIKVLSYQAIAKNDEEHRAAGEALFPELKSLDFLEGVKRFISASSWESLYQQSPFIEEGEMFKPDNIGVLEAVPVGTQFVRAWDFAATIGGGDWTVGFKLGKMPDGRLLIADVIRFQRAPEDVRSAMRNAADADSTRCKVRIPQDPGQAGKDQSQSMTRMLSGFNVVSKIVSGDKVTRAEGFASQVNVGNVLMLRSSWNQSLINEMRMFPNGPNDDQIDAGSDAFNELVGGGGGAEALFTYLQRQYEMKQKEAA